MTQVKKAILRLYKQNKPQRETAQTLRVNNRSTIWSILKKKECTGELSNWNISLVKRNPFATSSEVKNTFEEAGVSLPTSTIKRHLHKFKYRYRSKPLMTVKNVKAKLEFTKDALDR